MKKILSFTSLACGAFVLAACGQSDFANDDEKKSAFANYICTRDADSEIDWSKSAAVDVLADEQASKDDKKIALELATRTADRYKTELEMSEYGGTPPISPRLDPDDDGYCHGWVWEKHVLAEYDKDYENFTYEMATDSGSLPE